MSNNFSRGWGLIKELQTGLTAGVIVIFYICWAFGGVVGAIYWAVNEELLDVVLSIFIPMYGAISMIADLI